MNIFEDIFLNDFETKRNKTALIYDNRTMTYETLLTSIENTGEVFKKNGIGQGSRVVLFMENSIEFAVAFMALSKCKATIIPIYVKLGEEKLCHIFNFYEPEYIITNQKNVKSIDAQKNILSQFVSKVMMLDEAQNIVVDDLGGTVNGGYVADDIAIILSSSGTTSEPKGIMLTDINIITNTKAIAHYMGINGDDKILMVKSINHSSSITGEFLVGMLAGCTIVIHSGIMHAKLILDSLVKNKISVFFAVPTILNDLMRKGQIDRFDLSALRIIHFYGAVMNDDDMSLLLSTFTNCELIYSYGLTEAAPRVTYAKKEKIITHKGTSGVPLTGVEIRINYDDEKGKAENIGEIVVKGPNIMRGYFKNPKLTEKVLRNGELYTGDLGRLDDEGNLYVMGRKDNMMIKNGRNVFPEEIERVISLYSEVAEVLVAEKEEKIIAYVVPIESTVDGKELIQFCRKHLEDYKVPDKVCVISELKKNANNKILRNVEYN